jgi:hypothetical protein
MDVLDGAGRRVGSVVETFFQSITSDFPIVTQSDHCRTGPRITEIRLAGREETAWARASVAKVDRPRNWIFRNAAFWVLGGGRRRAGFLRGDPRRWHHLGLVIIRITKDAASPPRAAAAGLRGSARAGGFAAATQRRAPGTRGRTLLSANGWEETGRQDDGQIIFRRDYDS